MSEYRTTFGETIAKGKYIRERDWTWKDLTRQLSADVFGGAREATKHNPKALNWFSEDNEREFAAFLASFSGMAGGRYNYYAGRPLKAFNNCFLLRGEEDTREEWGRLMRVSSDCLMMGGGIGIDYSRFRARGEGLSRTGGEASGPIPLIHSINEIGRNVKQGGSRRAAIYASLNWQHADARDFLKVKDWANQNVPLPHGKSTTVAELKEMDFDYPAPLDHTNISLNYDDDWLAQYDYTGDYGYTFFRNTEMACRNGEPGYSFNFGDKSNETLRNAPVAADTHVYTKEGVRTVGDIVGTPTTVWTGKQWAENVTFTRTIEDSETLTIKMTGGREITCEPTHEFFVERWEGKGANRKFCGIQKVAAEDLHVGDQLHVSLPNNEKEVKIALKEYFGGFAYGDGSFACGGTRPEITFCSPESRAIATRFNTWLTNNASSVNWSDSRGHIRVYFRPGVLFDGPRFKERVGDEALSPSFLAGLFDADGNYSETQKAIRLCSKHESFLHDIRRALEMLGILSNVSKNGTSTFGGTQVYQLVVARSSNSRFARLIPTIRLQPEPHTAYRQSTIKVTGIEVGPDQDVFCADVKVPEHSFMAEGVIISNCTEVTSEDDSDVCNLASLNLARIKDLNELTRAVELTTIFLYANTLMSDLPNQEAYDTREKTRRLGLGLMGMHEWLLARGYRYEVTDELHEWLSIYQEVSDEVADDIAADLGLERSAGVRAIAPTGTISMVAGTTSGIEPIYAVAYKRRYISSEGRKFQYVVDPTAKAIIQEHNVDPDSIETSYDLAQDPERRIKFQADVQDYVDQSISSTLNLPEWGSEFNNEGTVEKMADIIAKYAHRLRGLTLYPDGARGGQPLVPVSYEEAIKHEGKNYVEEGTDVCDISGGGSCGD